MNSPSPSLTELSSDLSSVRSLSPPTPGDYPSPPLSQDQSSGDVGCQQRSRKRSRDPDEHTSPRKRTKAEPKPRKTEYLNLQERNNLPPLDQQSQLDTLLKVLRKKKKIVVIAGAGISVSAGSKQRSLTPFLTLSDHVPVPDFRSASGLFTTLKNEHNLKASGKHLFDASVYQTDSSTTSFHSMVRSLSKLASDAKPTAFHHLLATLGEQGRLMRLYTQNVDGIDTSLTPLATSIPLASKGPWPRTIQLHGGLEKMVCSKCNHLSDFEPALFDGPHPPPCRQCTEADKVRTDHAGKRSHGIGRLRPRIVLYNEHNPDDEAIGTVVSSDLRGRPDAVIVVGTSMKIPGVKRIVREMCGVVRAKRDGLAVWVNYDPPPVGKEFDECWDLVVKGSSDDVANFVKMRHWNDDEVDVKCCTELEAENAMREKGIQVLIESSQNGAANLMATPAASLGPKPQQQQTKLTFSSLRHVEIPEKKLRPSELARPTAQNAKGVFKSNGKPSKAKKSKTKASEPPNNAKINMAYKITKPREGPSEEFKRDASQTTTKEVEPHRPMAPMSSQSSRNIGAILIPSEKSNFPNIRTTRSICPEDLELRGPEKVVLASVMNKSAETASFTAINCIQGDCAIISPKSRLPTGMAMLVR
ncbi:MAG: hypothetical protein Q9211_004260 [Gyalolechia sp. 1 TL-2023]